MIDRRAVLAGAAGAIVAAGSAARAAQPAAAPAGAKNVVFVHGAFADGSSWSGVITILQAKGFRTIAVQNPLTSLADDVAATRRALAMQDGPTVLVGHSYGGVVITEAGDDPKVASLVYVAALAPEVGESFEELAKKFPTPPGFAHIAAHDGFAQLDEAGFLADFMPDVPRATARVMAASQGPVAATLFGDKTTKAAWKTRPSFYALSTQDHMLAPDFQRFVSKRMNATVTEIRASHASPVSHPADIAKIVMAAAKARTA